MLIKAQALYPIQASLLPSIERVMYRLISPFVCGLDSGLTTIAALTHESMTSQFGCKMETSHISLSHSINDEATGPGR